MEKSERLALAVRAQVASIRANQARERSALLERRFEPVDKAIEAYEKLYGEDADPTEHMDVLLSLIVQHGGGDLGEEDLLEGMTMNQERADAAGAAAEAMLELNEAMGDRQGTVLEWVGCTSEEFTTALEAALSA